MLNINDEQLKSIEENEYGFPYFNIDKIRYSNFDILFELKWLNSSRSIKNYYNQMNYFEDKDGHNFISQNGFIPDIVVFDYSLKDNEATAPKGYTKDFVKKTFDPCYTLDTLMSEDEKKTVLEEDLFPFKRKIDVKTTKDEPAKFLVVDRLGLYAGGIIVERFRHDAPCIGCPCTFFEPNILEGSEAHYFEWLLSVAFRKIFDDPKLRQLKNNKRWEYIIDATLPKYRDSILDMIKLNKIQVDLNELIALLDGKFLKNNDKEREYKYFSFRSV